MIDLDEIERRANAATKGPWTYHDGCGYVEVPPCGAIEFKPEWERSVHFLARVHNNHVEGEDGLGFDGAFIAAARADVPALVARVRELEAESRRFRDWYRNAFGGPSKRETPWDPCACEECESLRRLKDERLKGELPVHPSNLTDVVSLLEDERDELLVRVANQDAELRATRENYNEARAEVQRLKRERDAACMAAGEYSQDEVNAMTTEMIAIRKGYEKNAYRRGAEAMRDECIGAACGFYMGTTGFCNGDEDELEAVLEALPIPEEK